MNLAGCVVLYYPDREIQFNIGSYITHLDVLYVIDNSEKRDINLIDHIKKIPKVKYVWLKENKGIAFALNVAANAAMKDGFEWLLTMDQDSFFEKGQFESLLSYFYSIPDKVKVIGPSFEGEKLKTNEQVLSLITSGSMINLKAWKEIGGFSSKLFIDQVDHDFCYRIIIKGYKIIKVNDSKLNHKLGNQTIHKKWKIYNYPEIRYYYIFRNTLYIARKYSQYTACSTVRKDKIRGLSKYLISIWFEKKSIRKYFYAFCGVLDFIFGRYGKASKFLSRV